MITSVTRTTPKIPTMHRTSADHPGRFSNRPLLPPPQPLPSWTGIRASIIGARPATLSRRPFILQWGGIAKTAQLRGADAITIGRAVICLPAATAASSRGSRMRRGRHAHRIPAADKPPGRRNPRAYAREKVRRAFLSDDERPARVRGCRTCASSILPV